MTISFYFSQGQGGIPREKGVQVDQGGFMRRFPSTKRDSNI